MFSLSRVGRPIVRFVLYYTIADIMNSKITDRLILKTDHYLFCINLPTILTKTGGSVTPPTPPVSVHLQSVAGVSPVDQALMLVRQMASRPVSVFDPYSLIGTLENLEDVARRSAHNDVRRYAAVLSNCKKLPLTPQMGDFVTQVLGDDVRRKWLK